MPMKWKSKTAGIKLSAKSSGRKQMIHLHYRNKGCFGGRGTKRSKNFAGLAAWLFGCNTAIVRIDFGHQPVGVTI